MSTKEIYNNIANEFDRCRTKIWPCTSRFLNQFNVGSTVLDIGCGNGKNMVNESISFTGIDFSHELVKICQHKRLNVIEADMTCMPFDDESFDGFISIASYHHLDNDTDRKKALHEMHRILKKKGKGIIVVWAKEQDDTSKFVFNTTYTHNNQFGMDEYVLWKSRTGRVHTRYYHIYENDDLKNEINFFCPNLTVDFVGWEKGNWYAHVSK